MAEMKQEGDIQIAGIFDMSYAHSASAIFIFIDWPSTQKIIDNHKGRNYYNDGRIIKVTLPHVFG